MFLQNQFCSIGPREDLAYLSNHPELTAALELIFENVCRKCDEQEKYAKTRTASCDGVETRKSTGSFDEAEHRRSRTGGRVEAVNRKSTGSFDEAVNRRSRIGGRHFNSQSPVDLTIEFLSSGNLEELVRRRLAERERREENSSEK